MLPNNYISLTAKIPPQAKELEVAVLGAMMESPFAVTAVLSVIKNADIFYVNAHRLIFSAIVNLFTQNAPVDILTVTEELKFMGKLEDVGGAFYVTELGSNLFQTAHAEHHAWIIKQKWIQRERIRIASDIIKQSYDDTDDPLEGLGNDLDSFGNLHNAIATGGAGNFSAKVDEVFSAIAKAMTASPEEKQVAGLTTGNYEVDQKVRYRNGQFIAISGRPGHGKTSFALEGVLANAMAGVPIGFFSLEMTEQELIMSLISMASGVDAGLISKGDLTEEQQRLISDARDMIRELPIHIYDRGSGDDGIAMRDITSISKAWKAKYGVKLLFVDYLQLVSGQTENQKYSNREQDVSAISRGLKRLAMRLDIPVVGISALSRKLEDRSGWSKRPTDADMRESGSIEYDANVIIHVFRPEKLKLMQYEGDGVFNDGGSTIDTVEFDVSKSRGSGGRLGRIRQHIDNGTSRLSKYVPHVTQYAPAAKISKPKDWYASSEKPPEEDLPF